MNKKRLPRVIVHLRDDVGGDTGNDAGGAPTEPKLRPVSISAVSEGGSSVASIRSSGPGDGGITTSTEPSAAPLVGVVLDPAPPSNAINEERRRAIALGIVNRHAGYSAVGGIIPLPLANFASVTALIVRMVKVLSDHYGVAFERDRTRAIVVGLVGGAMPSGLSAVTSSTLLFLVPGSAFAGLAVSSFTAAACTRSIGRIFVEHFESGVALDDIVSFKA
jgi:uncharacterized protein (DUF697 family)